MVNETTVDRLGCFAQFPVPVMDSGSTWSLDINIQQAKQNQAHLNVIIQKYFISLYKLSRWPGSTVTQCTSRIMIPHI